MTTAKQGCLKLSKSSRSGAVLVEFALVLPVIMFTFACLVEISRVMLLQHTADTAAYEGARSAMVPGAISANAVNTATELLTAARLKTTKVTVTPALIDETTPLVTVLVEIPVEANYWISPMLFQNMIVKRRSDAIQRTATGRAVNRCPQRSKPKGLKLKLRVHRCSLA